MEINGDDMDYLDFNARFALTWIPIKCSSASPLLLLRPLRVLKLKSRSWQIPRCPFPNPLPFSTLSVSSLSISLQQTRESLFLSSVEHTIVLFFPTVSLLSKRLVVRRSYDGEGMQTKAEVGKWNEIVAEQWNELISRRKSSLLLLLLLVVERLDILGDWEEGVAEGDEQVSG